MDFMHIARDTDAGVETLCGEVDVLAVYPIQIGEYPGHTICSDCQRLARTT
jgi:hypothetical protein